MASKAVVVLADKVKEYHRHLYLLGKPECFLWGFLWQRPQIVCVHHTGLNHRHRNPCTVHLPGLGCHNQLHDYDPEKCIEIWIYTNVFLLIDRSLMWPSVEPSVFPHKLHLRALCHLSWPFNTVSENPICPINIIQTSCFGCRTSGYFKICNVFCFDHTMIFAGRVDVWQFFVSCHNCLVFSCMC